MLSLKADQILNGLNGTVSKREIVKRLRNEVLLMYEYMYNIFLLHKCHDSQINIQDNHYDRSCQAFGVATELIYIPSQTDYFIEPKKYETYDERYRRIDLLGKVKLIQRNFRRYLWQKLIRESAAEWRFNKFV